MKNQEHVLHDLKDLSFDEIADTAANSDFSRTAQQGFESIRDGLTAGVEVVDDFIRANPYAAVGVALGAGLFIGMLLGDE